MEIYYCNYCYEWALLSERREDILQLNLVHVDRYHGAIGTMESQEPWSHKNHGVIGTMEYLDLVQSDSTYKQLIKLTILG